MSIEQQGAERQAQATTQPSPPHGPEPSSSRPAREARARGSVAGRLRAGLPRPHSPETAFRHVQESVVGHYPQADVALLRQAFDFAQQAHRNQARVTGEPYVTHPLAAAKILADIGIDPVAVTAAILHDVPEDTDFTLNDVEERFGAEVAQLVDGVTKLSKFSTHSHEEQQAENIRKMFLAMA
jgi:guanosine-3',5'-bis(diphosphate) 3'-pyrophosphohydrolase